MRQYIGLIHKEAGSDFGVSFPDFPGVVTAGTSLDDARGMAEEALAFHIEGLVADGEAIPEPSSLTDVMADAQNRDAVATLVAVKTEAPKAVRVNVTLPEDVLEHIDRFAEEHGFTRSGFIAQAAKKAITPAQEIPELGPEWFEKAEPHVGGAKVGPRKRRAASALKGRLKRRRRIARRTTARQTRRRA